METTDYSALADQYASHRRVNPEVVARLKAAISPEARILEIGCGTGNYVVALHALTGCACVGVDPSPDMLAKLRARSSSISAIEAAAERLDLPARAFDLVYSVDVAHHLRDRDAAFREAFRVLREGGLVCTVTDSDWMIRHRVPQSPSAGATSTGPAGIVCVKVAARLLATGRLETAHVFFRNSSLLSIAGASY